MPEHSPPTAPDRSPIPDAECLQLRVHGDAGQPTLIYLPGLHGDWTLLGPFRSALAGRARLVEFAYPRRPEWQLADYARGVAAALLERGLTAGWLLGESFSSQVAWTLLGPEGEPGHPATLPFQGLILAGGFVRHPWPRGVWLARRASRAVPRWLLRRACQGYGWVARLRHATSADVAQEFREFVERRCAELDRSAITARYRLIERNDPRTTAQRSALPVFQLSGAWDPIVPWWQVRAWLRRHCPSFRASRILWAAGHNVLLSAPRESADQILAWIGQASAIPFNPSRSPRATHRSVSESTFLPPRGTRSLRPSR